jgi:hypothetical protein
MAWLAAAGWLLAIVFAVLWYVKPQTIDGRDVTPVSTPERSHIQVLIDRSGAQESVRTVRGAPPHCVYRPHGKRPATRYRYIGMDGSRHLYRAES